MQQIMSTVSLMFLGFVTYCHNTQNTKSYIDFLTVLSDLIGDICNLFILDQSLNHSNHYPIILKLRDRAYFV